MGGGTLVPDAGAGCKCRSWCEDGPSPGLRWQSKRLVGTGCPGRPRRPSRCARNGAEAGNCRAMPRHSVVERSRIALSIKSFWRLLRSRPRTLQAHGEAQTLRGPPGRTFHGTGGKAVRARTCTAVLVPLQRISWLRTTPQSPRVRRQPQRTQAGESHTRPPPLPVAAQGGTR